MSDRVLPPDRDFRHVIEDLYTRVRELERRLTKCSCDHGVKLKLDTTQNRPFIEVTDKDNSEFGTQFYL